MKKTRRKHLFRTIRKTGVSFFAVAFIAGTSIGIFQGLQSAADAILDKADSYFNSNNLETLEISCANGITKEDIQAIAQWDQVEIVEGGYTDSVLLDMDGEKTMIQARSLLGEMNQPVIIEGILPEAPNQAAVEEIMAEEKGIQIGDEITLDHEGCLAEDTFVVTAVINEPSFCCANVEDSRGKGTEGFGSNEYYIELTKDAFDPSYYEDCYTTAYIRSDALDGIFYFSDEYKEEEEKLLEELEGPAQERAQLRYASLKEDAEEELESAWEEIQEGEQELADGRTQIEEQEKELQTALVEIQTQLSAFGLSSDDLDAAAEALNGLGEAAAPLQAAIVQYQESSAQLDQADQELDQAQQDLDEAREELSQGEQDAADITEEEWILSGRNDIGDVRGVSLIVDAIYGLSFSLSLIFLLVAVVVCYAAITRMINEQRVLIGTQKALGFTSREILRHYLFYNTICAFLGILIGYALSVGVVEILILYVFSPEFLLGGVPLGFSPVQALISAGICIVVFLIASYAACKKLVRQPATDLLRGEVPVRSKGFFFEKWKVYKRMNLYSRTMIKNVMNDKGRMMTTIAGIMGCVALLVICFSMKMGIENSSKVQFDKYFLYDYRLAFDSAKGSAEEFERVLDENGISYILVQDKMENFRADGGSWENGRIVAAEDFEALKDYMVLEDLDTGKTAGIPEDGMLVSRKCAEMYDLSKGSTVEIMDEDGGAVECTISGVIEHYLPYHMFVTTDSYYETVMGEPADSCIFLINGAVDGLEEQVKDLDGFLSLTDNSALQANADTINMVIAVCLSVSVLMVLLVLMNQIVMYINRKARELAVMRINGYTMKETKAYVYKDNIVLTAAGLLLGCGLGVGLSYIIIRIIETGANRYVRTPNLLACLYSCGVVALFAVIVNLIALRKINKLSLTNVNAN